MPQIRLMLHQRVGPTRVNSSSMRVGRPRSMEAAADARSQNQTMNVSSAHRAFARKEHGGGFAAILSDSPGNKRPDALHLSSRVRKLGLILFRIGHREGETISEFRMTSFPQPRGVCLLFGLVGDLSAEFAESLVRARQ